MASPTLRCPKGTTTKALGRAERTTDRLRLTADLTGSSLKRHCLEAGDSKALRRADGKERSHPRPALAVAAHSKHNPVARQGQRAGHRLRALLPRLARGGAALTGRARPAAAWNFSHLRGISPEKPGMHCWRISPEENFGHWEKMCPMTPGSKRNVAMQMARNIQKTRLNKPVTFTEHWERMCPMPPGSQNSHGANTWGCEGKTW